MHKENSHAKGDLAEIKIITAALERGYNVSVPFSQDSRYDLIVDRNGLLERVQVKYTVSTEEIIRVAGKSTTSKGGKPKRHLYTQRDIEWLAVYDATDGECYFIPGSFLGVAGKDAIFLRKVPTKNNQVKGINWAKDFKDW